MSKKRKDLNGLLSNQGCLFDTEIVEGALDVSMAFRDSLTQALRKHNEGRWQVAAKVSELVGRSISKDMLDKYTSSNPEYGMRAEDLPAFCAVTRSIEPFRTLLDPLNHEVISPEEGDFVRLARIERKVAELSGEAAKIRSRLGLGR